LFERYLRAGNKSPRTIETYLEAVNSFDAHLRDTSGRLLEQARHEDIEAWVGLLLQRWKPATAHNRYRGLHAFYRWLEQEEGVPSPMAKMKPPAVPDQGPDATTAGERTHCLDLPLTQISVCWPVATSDLCLPWTPNTSSRHTVSVRPDFRTVPRASRRSPTAGARRLILYSTVSTDVFSGNNVNAA
jgi:hypothetical protein